MRSMSGNFQFHAGSNRERTGIERDLRLLRTGRLLVISRSGVYRMIQDSNPRHVYDGRVRAFVYQGFVADGLQLHVLNLDRVYFHDELAAARATLPIDTTKFCVVK